MNNGQAITAQPNRASACKQPKLHFVHIYHVTRTKFGVLATNHQDAIKAAEHEFETLPSGQTWDSDTPGYLGSEDACEVLSFMVDEAGDEEFERSASYEADGITPSRTSIAASPGLQRFVFAAARDGDMLLDTIEAASIDQARTDAIALAPMTDRITYLEEGDWAVITRAGAEIFDAADRRANRAETRIQIEAARIEKGGYKHFMAKEIAEQPVVIADALKHYTGGGVTPALRLPEGVDFTAVDRVVMVACGTASYACHVAKYWFEQIAGLPAEVDIASEFRYRDPVLSEKSWAVFVSQSGETADTLAALRHCKEKVAKVVSVVNVPTSSIARESDLSLPIMAGVEVGVASTKAFTCQLTVLALLAVKAGLDRGRLTAEQAAAHLGGLRNLPGLMNHALGLSGAIAGVAEELAEAQDVLFLGRGAMYPLALEGALKLKEISYIHAEGYASGELKHGPIALIDARVPVIVLAPRDHLFDKTVSNMQEVMARHGKVLLISDAAGVAEAGQGVWKTLVLPEVEAAFAPILYAVPAQLLAYHTAIAKGTDVDQPRNLAKSVTVE